MQFGFNKPWREERSLEGGDRTDLLLVGRKRRFVHVFQLRSPNVDGGWVVGYLLAMCLGHGKRGLGLGNGRPEERACRELGRSDVCTGSQKGLLLLPTLLIV